MAGKARTIHIYRVNSLGRERLISSRWSTSLKQALKDHWADTLSHQGWEDPLFTGNKLVADASAPGCSSGEWVAKETK